MLHTAASGTTNGAVSDSTTITVDGVSGTIAVGQVVTVNGAGSAPAASITRTKIHDTETVVVQITQLLLLLLLHRLHLQYQKMLQLQTTLTCCSLLTLAKVLSRIVFQWLLKALMAQQVLLVLNAYRTGFGVDTLVGRVSMLEDGTVW